MTLRELFQQFEKRSLTEGATRVKCRSAWQHLMLRLGTEFDVAKVSSEHIDRYQRYLRDEAVTPRGRSFSDATVFSYTAAVSQVFTWAAAKNRRYVKTNPVRDADRLKATKRLVQVFARDEVVDILDTVRGDERRGLAPLRWVWWDKSGTLRWTATILTALCGPRIGEIWNLRWEDVDLDGRVLHIRSRPDQKGQYWRWTAKGKAERDVPLSMDLTDVIRRLREVASWRYPYLKQRQCEQLQAKVGRLTEAQRKKPYDTWSCEWSRVLRSTNERRRREGRPEIVGCFHQLRKNAATAMAEAGVPSHFCQAILGHTTDRLTREAYIHVDQDKAMDAARKAFDSCRF